MKVPKWSLKSVSNTPLAGVGSASHKSCVSSVRATTVKIFCRKRFRKPQKIIALQAQAQVWCFEKYNSNWLTAQTSLGYGTKPIFKTNYALYEITSHICCPIRLVFHQHLNSHVAYPGIPPEPSNHTRGQFLHLPSYPLLRLLWSKSDNKVTRKRILDQYHTGTSLSSTALR